VHYVLGRSLEIHFFSSPKHIGNNYLPPFIIYFLQPHFSKITALSLLFGDHLTKDHSSIPNLSRSFRFTDPCCSPLQFNTLIFYRVQVREWGGHCRCLVLCSVTHFCVEFDDCFRITVLLDDPKMAHYKVSSRGCQVLCQVLSI